MDSNTLPQSAPAIRAALQYHRNCVAALEVAYAVLQEYNPQADPRRYSGKIPAQALSEFLNDRGGSEKFQTCLRELLDGGCSLGQRAESNLKTIITRNTTRFTVRGERIFLLCKAVA